MRNALILTGLWLGILITAYAIVFWGNGIDRPLPISVLDQQTATATESEYAQPDGLFSVSIPVGWQTVQNADYLEIDDPNGLVSVWVIAENTTSLEEALNDVLTVAGDASSFVVDPADLPSEPWDGSAVTVTSTSDAGDEVILLRAERPQDWTVVMAARGSEKVLTALSENLDWIWSSLSVPANELQII
jgi:hypothetical protein